LDPEFPALLAAHAAEVARRYPWIDAYTPINEPLTTARFSGLYGIWYPHARDAAAMIRVLLNEVKATALSMRAVRALRPDAQLVQTEDLGQVFSTTLLRYQADFENLRRWLSLDLLTGRVTPDHELYRYLVDHGADPEELAALAADPCPPDIIGINHYVTSNRFLDERLERYPTCAHGGNHRHRYADIEAVRVGAERLIGPRELLSAVWERYHRPIAVTEAHLGGSRDEQLRWLDEIWRVAKDLRDDGVDLRAVTAWSLLGSFDWNSLVTRDDGFYESGVFDLVDGKPRPTRLAEMVRAFATGKHFDHPALDTPGWWRRPVRLLYAPVSCDEAFDDSEMLSAGAWESGRRCPRKILITGHPGTLATALAIACENRGLHFRSLGRKDLDITDPYEAQRALDELEPWAVINAAGYLRVDDAEREVEACMRANTDGPVALARACARRGIPLVTYSTDLVFDGVARTPYVESAAVAPLNVYGRSKAEAEARVSAVHPGALIIRTSAFFGPWDEHNFLVKTLRRLARGETVDVAHDQQVSPTYVPDLAHASLDLLIDGEHGVWHLANLGSTSWADFARIAADRRGLPTRVRDVPGTAFGLPAHRPSYSVLGSHRGRLLPSLESAVDRFCNECRVLLT
jgi:dTDP-4-dehydrorhamnose reductase